MEIQIFWNKAIEYHCLKNSNETIFIAVSEDSLEDIYNNYFLQLNELNSKIVQITIKSFGGIKASYFEALKKVFFNTNEGAFCFLKFSIFVLSAFELNTTNGYWGNFDKKLLSNINQTLNPYRRTDFIDSVIDNLKKFCRNQNTVKKYDWNGEKIFLDLNIYGNNTNRINVGRIYAHSIFTASTINNVKKAMYELGIA